MTEQLVVVEIQSGKKVKVPKELIDNGRRLSARAYAVETGQATWEEVNGEPAVTAGASGPIESALISAGKTTVDLGSNLKQFFAEMFGNDAAAEREKAKQAEANRLFSPLQQERPISTFAGSMLPYFAVPGGKALQIGAGAVEGALSGDTPEQRLLGAGIGAGAGFLGQKIGDKLGARVQNAAQRARGNPNAMARKELLDAGVPLTLSQRTDSPISRPLARFFERGRFVLTGSQPKGAAQQKRLTELVGDALGINSKKLTREALGKAVNQNDEVFQRAASRVQGQLVPDERLVQEAAGIISEFDRVGSDSAQVKTIFKEFRDFAGGADLFSLEDASRLDPDRFLKLRSRLSAATTKSDIETEPLVAAIKAMDERLAREVPDLADDLMVARDRFRLLLAIRRGRALSPQGDINVNTFTNNLERVFNDFDVGKPLPRGLRESGEAIAAFNQITDPFRSSATAENLAALGGGGLGAAADPALLVRFLTGTAAPFAGGGTGGLLGGGVGRTAATNLLALDPNRPQ
jgi:hypothetical protein